MISTENKVRTTQILSDLQPESFTGENGKRLTKKPLEARWSTVKGKLVCQWVQV